MVLQKTGKLWRKDKENGAREGKRKREARPGQNHSQRKRMKYFAILSGAMAFLLDVSLMLSILLTLLTPSFLISTISRSILSLFSSHPHSDQSQHSHHDATWYSSRFRFLRPLQRYETIARERATWYDKHLSSNWPCFPRISTYRGEWTILSTARIN